MRAVTRRCRGVGVAVLALAFLNVDAAEQAMGPADVVATFQKYEDLNDEFLSSLEMLGGQGRRPYEELRRETESYAEGPLRDALGAGTDIICTNADAAVLKALFHLAIATANSGHDAPAQALGQAFECQPELVSSEFRRQRVEVQPILFESLSLGFEANARLRPKDDTTTRQLRARLDSLRATLPP